LSHQPRPTCVLQCPEGIFIRLVIADVDGQHVSLLLQAQHLQQMQQRTTLVPINLAAGGTAPAVISVQQART
jgi:hypothetical protein